MSLRSNMRPRNFVSSTTGMGPIQDVADLRQRLMSTGADFQQSVVDESIDQRQK